MRKVIHTSIALNGDHCRLIATCEDGTVWEKLKYSKGGVWEWSAWEKLSAIPFLSSGVYKTEREAEIMRDKIKDFVTKEIGEV
jgi:hypothetical protein